MANTADDSKCNNLVKADPGRSVGIIGIPMNKGQEKKGTEKAPDHLRQGGLIKKLEGVGRQIKDYGNMHFQKENEDPDYLNVRNPKYVAQATLQIADTVEKILCNESQCIALGGDHSIAIGTISGHARVNPDIVILWIDAHGDINTPLTSDSGNIHGMPLSFLIKQLDPYIPPLPGWEDINPCIDGKQIAWIGLRSVDPGESKIFDKFGFHTFYMDDIDELGIRKVLKSALKAVDPEGVKPIHVSFDVDSLDPIYIPCTGTLEKGGLTVKELSYIADEIAKTGRLAMIDVVEVNPKLGNQEDLEKTIQSSSDLVTRFFQTDC